MEALCRSRATCAVVENTKTRRAKRRRSRLRAQRSQNFYKDRRGRRIQQRQWINECNQDEAFQMIEANGEFQKMIMEGSVVEVEESFRNYLAEYQDWLGWDEELMEEFGERVRGVVVEKRREKGPGKSRTGAGQGSAFQGRGTVTGDPRTEHRRTRRDERPWRGEGRPRKCRPRPEEEIRGFGRTRREGEGKGNGRKGEHGSKGGLGSKGGQQNARKKGEDEEDERVQVAPNMGAGGS